MKHRSYHLAVGLVVSVKHITMVIKHITMVITHITMVFQLYYLCYAV